ncbi:MAG: alpha-ketoglutarate-dependent dioxygenase AlkB, partial [Bacteroidia bacterium]|nr:alpha-ketoglutarate-dependent dioxygenase AlkB [Bacteroidia bacterium]
MPKTNYNHPVNILPHEGKVFLYPGFFNPNESAKLFKELMHKVPWKQEPIRIFGKEIMQPRLTAWYADKGISYSYSGITMKGFDWNEPLLLIKKRIENFFKISCNSALLNLYRDGNDSMGWHRDNEKELGRHPVIISVSFGAARKFQLREYKTKENLISLDL